MKFDLAIIGYGVIGVESLHALVSKGKKQKLNVVIIEKNTKNIPGGVAYSKDTSKFGFFNNPLRLSHPSFQKWISKNQNKNKIINFIKKNPSYHLDEWLKNNFSNLMKREVSKEIYFPRLVYSFYLEEKIIETFKLLRKSQIKIFCFKGELDKIEFEASQPKLKSKSSFQSFDIRFKKNIFKINLKKKHVKFLYSKKIIIGNGLLPPKKIELFNLKSCKNYIWDFYSEGGTNNLLKKINLLKKKKKKILLTFIGNKAGLLETTLQMKRLINIKKVNLNINVISSKFATLNKAEFSKNFKKFKLVYFNKKKLNKIRKANDILVILKKEFLNAKSKGFNKYDVWTNVLKKNVLEKSILKLNHEEKKKYNLSIFPQIRNITRFTYSKPIVAKENLERNKKINWIRGKATSIKYDKKNLFIKINEKKLIRSDLVINVSGPVDLKQLDKEVTFIKSIKERYVNKVDMRGFITNKNFMLTKQIFMPGTIAYNFNPSRQTIIKAITNNSRKVIKFLLSNLSKN